MKDVWLALPTWAREAASLGVPGDVVLGEPVEAIEDDGTVVLVWDDHRLPDLPHKDPKPDKPKPVPR